MMRENGAEQAEKHAMGPEDDRLPVHPTTGAVRETDARIQSVGSHSFYDTRRLGLLLKYTELLSYLKYDPVQDIWWMSGEDGKKVFGEARKVAPPEG